LLHLSLSLAPLLYNSFIMKITSVVLVLLSVVAVSQAAALLGSSQGHRIETRADDVLPDNVKTAMKEAIHKYYDRLSPAAKEELKKESVAFEKMDPEERRKALEKMESK
jgi:hypothetical protein